MCSINFKLPDQLLNLFCYQNCLYIAYMNNMIKKKKKQPAMTMMGLRRMLERMKMCMSSRESNWRPLLVETGDAIFTILSHSSSQFWDNNHKKKENKLYFHTQKSKNNAKES